MRYAGEPLDRADERPRDFRLLNGRTLYIQGTAKRSGTRHAGVARYLDASGITALGASVTGTRSEAMNQLYGTCRRLSELPTVSS